MLKMAILSLCLVVSPFLQAEKFSSLDTSGVSRSSVYVFSDYKGTLYIDRRKVGRLNALSGNPLKIDGLLPGPHLLQQRIPDGEIINCDVEFRDNEIAYVYLRLDAPVVGKTMEELNYKPKSHVWIYAVVGLGAVALAGLIILIIITVKTPRQSQDAGVNGFSI